MYHRCTGYKPNSATILCSLYDPTVVGLVHRILDQEGYNVLIKKDATEAIPFVSESHLIVSDVTNGGYDLYDHASKNHPNIKLIFLDGGLLEPARVPGALVLPKPFNFTDLAELVNKHVPEHLKPKKQQ